MSKKIKPPLPSLESLEHKIDQVEKRASEPELSSKALHGSSRANSLAFRMGIDFSAGIAVGTVLGIALDEWLHTAPLFLLIGICFGCAAGVKMMLHTNAQMQTLLQKDEAAKQAESHSEKENTQVG